MNEDNLLTACRQEIDKIDREIVDLFVRRMDVSSRIAGYKKEHALPVWDPTREKEKLSAVQSASPEEPDAFERRGKRDCRRYPCGP